MAVESVFGVNDGSLKFPLYSSADECIGALRGVILPRSERPLQMIAYNQLNAQRPNECVLVFLLREEEQCLAGYVSFYDISRLPEHFHLWDSETRASFESRRLAVEYAITAITEAIMVRNQLHVPVDIVTQDGRLIQGERFNEFLGSGNIQPWRRISS